ncbi:hypothetical protein [Lysobacter solisilvae (ex Woo and Kim 2020)]|uniref:Uncharacterized protein n=1 Tax=Agrilutibacter terrestris TaxID=2865112 RepID=A0A7H0G098_9GAMM|nr:hypothetical protein [Lysobacter terrestris]QNP41714.1 hypothetical protein H8B22_05765 [Lysobacter terrestris]
MNIIRNLAAFLACCAAGAAFAGEVVVDDGSTNSRSILAPGVPGTLTQSFTAEDARIRFGFRIHDELVGSLNARAPIVYNLYAGENSQAVLLATRTVHLPTEIEPDDPRNIFNDYGFVEAWFHDIALVVGQKYTMEIVVDPADPVTGGVGVWTSLVNPYAGGRFFFSSGVNNDFFSEQDMLFRMTPVTLTGVATELFSDMQAFGGSVRYATQHMFENNARFPRTRCGNYQGLMRFLEHYAATERELDAATAADFIFRLEIVSDLSGCP